MTQRWAIRLCEREHARLAKTLAPLRLVPGIELLRERDTHWLRGPDQPDPSIDAALRALAGDRFTIRDDAQLVPSGARVPRGSLPTGHWKPLCEWLGVVLPDLAYAAAVTERVDLRLVRGGSACEANVLLTTPAHWKHYASGAAQIRLQGLRFAASADEVIVHGTPLPPLPGLRLVARDGVAVPAGWTWEPPVDPAVLRVVFAIADGDLAIWRSTEQWTHLRQADFVHATRSAARQLVRESSGA